MWQQLWKYDFKLIILNISLDTSCEIALRLMPQNLTNEESALVQAKLSAVRQQVINSLRPSDAYMRQ